MKRLLLFGLLGIAAIVIIILVTPLRNWKLKDTFGPSHSAAEAQTKGTFLARYLPEQNEVFFGGAEPLRILEVWAERPWMIKSGEYHVRMMKDPRRYDVCITVTNTVDYIEENFGHYGKFKIGELFKEYSASNSQTFRSRELMILPVADYVHLPVIRLKDPQKVISDFDTVSWIHLKRSAW